MPRFPKELALHSFLRKISTGGFPAWFPGEPPPLVPPASVPGSPSICIVHCIELHCIALHCIALLCFALLCFALLCFALLLLCFALLFLCFCFALHCFALLCIALLCFALRCFALHCFGHGVRPEPGSPGTTGTGGSLARENWVSGNKQKQIATSGAICFHIGGTTGTGEPRYDRNRGIVD